MSDAAQLVSLWTLFATAPELLFLRLGAAFVLGSILASFVTLCAERHAQGHSFVRPGSHCSHCHHPLTILQLVPVAGWLLQGGRCAFCKTPIPWRYPVLEAGLGLVFLALCSRWGWTPAFLVHVPVLCLLLWLALTDWLTLRLPDKITFLALGCVLAGKTLLVLTGPESLSLAGLLKAWAFWLGTGALAALFLLVMGRVLSRRAGREALGLGDVKLGLVLGTLLEEDVFVSLALASVLALLAARLGLPGWAGQRKASEQAEQAEQAGASEETRIPDQADASAQTKASGQTRASDQPQASGQPQTTVVAFGPCLVLGALCTLAARALMP